MTALCLTFVLYSAFNAASVFLMVQKVALNPHRAANLNKDVRIYDQRRKNSGNNKNTGRIRNYSSVRPSR